MNLPATGDPYWLLDAVAGWQQSAAGSEPPLVFTPDAAALTLCPLPGTASDAKFTALADALTCPSALAVGHCGRLLVADAGADAIHRIDLATMEIETLSGLGGHGVEPRQLSAPRGVAALAGGSVAVADTENARVQVFSASPHALLQLWDEPGLFARPWGLAADACGGFYVAIRGARRVLHLAPDGTQSAPFRPDVLHDPTRIAVSRHRAVAVVDRDPEAAGDRDRARVVTFLPDGLSCTIHARGIRPRSVAFDDSGNLYVGDAIGLIHVFAADADDPLHFERAGIADTGMEREIADLVWAGKHGLIALIAGAAANLPAALYHIDPAGACALAGCLTVGPLDSRLETCVWDRLRLEVTMPRPPDDAPPTAAKARAVVEIKTFTSEVRERRPADDEWTTSLATTEDDPDCLVRSAPGRFLWLRVTLRSDGRGSPLLHSIRAHFPRNGYLQHLPSVFQEDRASRDFLERFLAIFQAGFDAFDERLDTLWQLFDPASVPEKFFPVLAAWLALEVDPAWSWEKKRAMLRATASDYPRRGTVDGLEKAISDYAGVPYARVLEHFRLRRWPVLNSSTRLDGTAPLGSRDFYKRLQLGEYSQLGTARLTSRPEPGLEPYAWGAHKFTVFFPADPQTVDETREKVARIVEREKPAHTQPELCPVFPRFRVGVQATLGFDSVVGGIDPLVLGKISTLGYDTILSCSAEERQLRALGSSITPRLGIHTKLL